MVRKKRYLSFDGPRNRSKARIFIVLYHRKYKLCLDDGLGVSELSRQSAVSLSYVRSKMIKWVRWHYLLKKPGVNSSGRPVFVYSLAAKAEEFIEDKTPREVIIQLVETIKTERTLKPE